MPDKKIWQSKGQKFRLLLNKGQRRWRELENAFQCHIYGLGFLFNVVSSFLLLLFFFFFLSIIRGLMTQFHNTDSSSFFLVKFLDKCIPYSCSLDVGMCCTVGHITFFSFKKLCLCAVNRGFFFKSTI